MNKKINVVYFFLSLILVFLGFYYVGVYSDIFEQFFNIYYRVLFIIPLILITVMLGISLRGLINYE